MDACKLFVHLDIRHSNAYFVVASSLKAPSLPSKPFPMTLTLVGKGYMAAGQAGACLQTMSALQAYQTDLFYTFPAIDEISRQLTSSSLHKSIYRLGAYL